jgi:sugar lactone lactonase YvrE
VRALFDSKGIILFVGGERGVTPLLVSWSPDGKFLYLHSTVTRQTSAVSLRAGEIGLAPPRAFGETRRNTYRIPVP